MDTTKTMHDQVCVLINELSILKYLKNCLFGPLYIRPPLSLVLYECTSTSLSPIWHIMAWPMVVVLE